MKNKKLIIIGITLLVLVLFVSPFLIKEIKYQTGLTAIINKEYDEAIDVFSNLYNYKDSNNQKFEAYYQKAIENMEMKSYEEALAILNDISTYKDSEELSVECQFYIAEGNYKTGKYSEALDILNAIIDYEKSEELVNDIMYSIASQSLENKEYIEAYNEFINLGSYKDSKSQAENILQNNKNDIYTIAVSTFNNDKFEEALSMFLLLEDYDNSEYYIEAINLVLNLQGTWVFEELSFTTTLTINNLSATRTTIYSSPGNHQRSYELEFDIYEDRLSLKVINSNFDGTWFLYENGNLLNCTLIRSRVDMDTYKKVSDITTVDKLKDPEIGMTVEEVLVSTWGRPEDINKTTTKYGTSEQWCYPGYKYIYFEDGIVDSISE